MRPASRRPRAAFPCSPGGGRLRRAARRSTRSRPRPGDGARPRV